MFCVALVGPDGSGKTTIAKSLLASLPLPAKYLYMGNAIQSSNHSLPTSRIIQHLKEQRYRRILKGQGQAVPKTVTHRDLAQRKLRRNAVEGAVGTLNALAEEWYRQIVALSYELSGHVVLCDRHFLFEHLPDSASAHPSGEPFSRRLHMWLLRHFYPQPDLVIFLEAPAELLMARKQEWTVEYLRRQQQGILEQGAKSKKFVRVDASQATDRVAADVSAHILEYHRGRGK